MACKECGGNGGHHKPGCGMSPAALQINNKDCTLFHSVTIPAIMGDETENPPANGLYKNVLLYYEASGNAYFYSSDGIPTKLTYATTDYNALTNKPTINGVTLEGNQSSSSLGININDATLTVKQGDTTLGTFSANASENVEINIPESDLPLSFTMRYDAGTAALVLPGWGNEKSTELVYENNNHDKVYKFVLDYGSNNDHPVSFLNDNTSESLTPNEFYELLLNGADVILNHVPIGSIWSSEFADGSPYANGLRLKRFTSLGYSGEESGVIGFGGTASIGAFLGGLGDFVETQLGFVILGSLHEGAVGYDRMLTQGLSFVYGPN